MSLTTSAHWMYNPATGFYGTEIENSLRFNDDDSAYLVRTPASNGTRTTWTLSFWVKRCELGTNNFIFSSGSSTSNYFLLGFNSDDRLVCEEVISAANTWLKRSSNVYRDVSSWYHVTVVLDTNNGTASDRVRMYVNNERITSFVTDINPGSGTGTQWNGTTAHDIGRSGSTGLGYYDGYLSEINFIDGQALDPTSFGETKSGVWIPKEYSGSYGTNGFHLEFAGNANDTSGNGNNFTSYNISSYDYVPDSPTNNFATMNSVDKSTSGAYTFSQGNLVTQAPGTNWVATRASMFVSSGKWYWECRFNAGTMTEIMNGIADVSVANTTNIWTQSGTLFFYNHIGGEIRYNNGTDTNNNYGTLVAGDILGVALDMDAKTISFYKNGSILVNSFSINYTNVDNVAPVGLSDFSNVIYAWNFGQDSTFAGATTAGGNADDNGYGDFKYAPPSGYLALCTANLPDPAIDPAEDDTPEDYFNTVLYTGNSGTNSITGVGFQPDFVWVKSRNNTYNHELYDVIRGQQRLYTDLTNAEDTGSLTSFDSDGFTHTSGTIGGNASGTTYVGWNWKAGGTGVSNTDGSVTSTVSANTDAGFSVVTWTGNGVTGATIGHGLGAKPDWILLKKRSATSSWYVYNSARGATKYITLPGRPAEQTSSGAWNNTEPTSSVFTTGSFGDVKDSGATFVAYCFANKDGFSKAGSYVGNGSSNGPFIYTGFRPAWIMIKRYDTTNAGTDWFVFNTKTHTYNDSNADPFLEAGQNTAEQTALNLDILSNGFKPRDSSQAWNTSGGGYLYFAFAEQPFKYANAR